MRKHCFQRVFSLSAGGQAAFRVQLPDSHFPPATTPVEGTLTGRRFTPTGVHWDRRPFVLHPGGRGSLPPRWGTKGGGNVNLIQFIPLLIVFAALLIAYDLAQKHFVVRLIQKAKDEKEREAILAALTARRR